jgi:RNA 2',3'-cyclic 3'-phosphodiesterase
MRLFAAIVPPVEVLDDLAEFLQPRQEASHDLRWTDPHQWHLTLAFMPEVPERNLEDLIERLGRAAARRHTLEVAIAGAGAFPNPYAARVLWAGVNHEGDGLRQLARGIRAVCAKAGAAPQGTRFHPHLTLARLRRPAEATRWLRVLDSYAGPAWSAREVTLIESHLGEGRGHRPRYEVMGTFPLGSG